MKRRTRCYVLSAIMLLYLHPSWAVSICSNLSFTAQLGVLDAESISQVTNDLTITAGVPIAVRIAVKNVGQTPLVVNLNNLQLTNKRNGFIVDVLESGSPVDCPVLLPQGPEMDHPVTLQPGEKKEGNIVLTSYYPALSRRGQFEIRVSYSWDWAFYILTRDGSKHPYEKCRCESEVVHLRVVEGTGAQATIEQLGAIEDGDYGAHFVYALVHSSVNETAIPTAESMSKWKGSYARLYVETLCSRYPKKADYVMQKIFDGASTTSLLKLRKLLGKHKEVEKHLAPVN